MIEKSNKMPIVLIGEIPRLIVRRIQKLNSCKKAEGGNTENTNKFYH